LHQFSAVRRFGRAMKLLVTEARGGRRHEITCAPTLSVGELKEKLSRLSGVAVDEQDLRLMGDSLCDEATLAEQGVQDRERIELVVLGGGADADASAGSAAAPIELEPAAPPPSAPSPSGGGAAASAFSGRIGAELRAVRSGLDALEKRVRSEKVHQEHFTRVLEQLDALDLDGLGDDERAAVRRERKALVLRCERLSAKV